jgi:activin receptor type-2B
MSPLTDTGSLDTNTIDNVQLDEVKEYGRFGCVWRGRANGATVAVKVFQLSLIDSWSSECNFYHLIAKCRHDNILQFVAAGRRVNELWLVTEYHSRGSLYDYLKGNTLSSIDAVTIALTMCRGLVFLHSPIGDKPIIAHRDFKSRNVLLRDDFTACISDFGLALVLDHQPGDMHGQVGTRRYMSPEVLDGSINFTIDHFLKVDVYALSLVLWELLSRIRISAETEPDEYRMPFEQEVGSHPSLEQMQEVVVSGKKRPLLKDAWYKTEVTTDLCNMIDECWDPDPEARLTSHCVEERLLLLRDVAQCPSSSDGSTPPSSSLIYECERVAKT